MDYEESITYITGGKDDSKWSSLSPVVFYKDKLPYGLVAQMLHTDGYTYIASRVTKDSLPFTVEMIRFLLTLQKEKPICLITDNVVYQEQIASVLSKHGFKFRIIEDVLYSYSKET